MSCSITAEIFSYVILIVLSIIVMTMMKALRMLVMIVWTIWQMSGCVVSTRQMILDRPKTSHAMSEEELSPLFC